MFEAGKGSLARRRVFVKSTPAHRTKDATTASLPSTVTPSSRVKCQLRQRKESPAPRHGWRERAQAGDNVMVSPYFMFITDEGMEPALARGRNQAHRHRWSKRLLPANKAVSPLSLALKRLTTKL